VGGRLTLRVGFESRDDQPPFGPAAVDQLLSSEARAGPQVGEVALRGTRPDAHELGRGPDGPAGGDEGSEDVHLAPSGWPRERTAQVPVSHANSLLAAASHSSRPSIGIV
jgi:hypothetical protein